MHIPFVERGRGEWLDVGVLAVWWRVFGCGSLGSSGMGKKAGE